MKRSLCKRCFLTECRFANMPDRPAYTTMPLHTGVTNCWKSCAGKFFVNFIIHFAGSLGVNSEGDCGFSLLFFEKFISAVRGTARMDKHPAAHARTWRELCFPRRARMPPAEETFGRAAGFDSFRGHNETPLAGMRNAGGAAPGLKAVETFGIRRGRSARPAPYCSLTTGARAESTVVIKLKGKSMMNTFNNRQNANNQIDFIFKNLLPAHGMMERPGQIELAHTM